MKTTIKLMTAVILAALVLTACSLKDDDITKDAEKIVISMSEKGKKFNFIIDAKIADRDDVWIDLNNNGLREDGEDVTEFNSGYLTVTPPSKTFTIYGKVTKLHSSSMEAVDASKNSVLADFDCYNGYVKTIVFNSKGKIRKINCATNYIEGDEMTKLMKSLPTVPSSETAEIYVIDTGDPQGEENECTKAQVKIATDKNWKVYDYYYGGNDIEEYPGS